MANVAAPVNDDFVPEEDHRRWADLAQPPLDHLHNIREAPGAC